MPVKPSQEHAEREPTLLFGTKKEHENSLKHQKNSYFSSNSW
nr:MAG TPA: hypothetical protein [Caudoviricetes sp.]